MSSTGQEPHPWNWAKARLVSNYGALGGVLDFSDHQVFT